MNPPASPDRGPDLTVLAGEWTKAATTGQATALALLRAEYLGLVDQFARGSAPRSAEVLREEAAQIEASFDNMPV